MLSHWIRRHKRALANVCCEEILAHNIHSHIDYKERLAEIKEVIYSLHGDNSPEFNRQKRRELEELAGIYYYYPDQQEDMG